MGGDIKTESKSIQGESKPLTDIKPETSSISDRVDFSSSKPLTDKAVKTTPQIKESVAPKEIGLQGVAPYPKDLYQVADGGKKVTKVNFIYDPGGRETLSNLKLVGSWDNNTGRYSNKWDNSTTPMKKLEDGRFAATITIVDEGQHDWEWGVMADAPSGKNRWAVFEEGNLKFNPSAENKTFEYSPTNYHKMGSYKENDDIGFRYWAPNARDVQVKVWDDDPAKAVFYPMEKDPATGHWSSKVENGWKEMDGKNYMFSVVTSEGKKVDRVDPYARVRQGVQRGINVIYLHPKSGRQVHQFHYEDGKPTFTKMMRFEVQDQPDADAVYLKLADENGNPISKEDLHKRLGDFDSNLVSKYHQGKLNDFYTENMEEPGTIKLVKQGNAWASIFPNADKMPGLKYHFEVYKKDENGKLQLVGDLNKDGVLQPNEMKKTHFNDPYSNTIEKEIGWERAGVISNPKAYVWKNDDVPRMTTDQKKFVIYQAHIGSFMGDAKNVQRSSIKDMINKLEYFKELGVNSLEILPTNATEGTRDWGYIGTNTFAQTDNYGFVDENGEWVNGTEALKRFVDEAHGLGFNVFTDVVYNHFGGEYCHTWEADGKQNPWFNWNGQSQAGPPGSGIFKSMPGQNKPDIRGVMTDAMPYSPIAKTKPDLEKLETGNNLIKSQVKHTPWGAMPAYNQKPVSDFVVNNAMMHMDELKFDGIRFDFTNPIHSQAYGGTDGWNMLRKTNRMIHFFYPKAMTSAEEFPNAHIITQPAQKNGQGGAGFNNMWNTEFQHRLIHNHGQAGVVQSAANDWKPHIDRFMDLLTHPPGFESWMNSVTVISNHDEVGNADRIINTTQRHLDFEYPSDWGRSAARLAFGIGMLSPGIPIFFQGDESLAKNRFSWGISSTWDVGWEWKNAELDQVNWSNANTSNDRLVQYSKLSSVPQDQWNQHPEISKLNPDDRKIFEYIASQKPEDQNKAIYNVARNTHLNFTKDIIHFRNNSQALEGDARINRVYSHEENGVFSFHREKGGEELLVFSSVNKNHMGNYNIPLIGGKWELVFNSNDSKYGGDGFGHGKPEIHGNAGTTVDLPAGGFLVYKKVGD